MRFLSFSAEATTPAGGLPTMKKEALSESQMKIQKLYLKGVGGSVGIKLGKDSATSISDLFVSEQARMHYAASAGEVSASGEPNLTYYIPKQYEDLYFSYVQKVRDLLRKSLNHRDKETRLHYQLMLHMLDKAL